VVSLAPDVSHRDIDDMDINDRAPGSRLKISALIRDGNGIFKEPKFLNGEHKTKLGQEPFINQSF